MHVNIHNSPNLASYITRRARMLLFQDVIVIPFDVLIEYKIFVRNRFFNEMNPFHKSGNLSFLPSILENSMLQQKDTLR